MKVLSVFGTRPETIKLAPVIKEMESHPRTEVCWTRKRSAQEASPDISTVDRVQTRVSAKLRRGLDESRDHAVR